MFFTRTHKYNCPIHEDDFKNRLIGKHVRIHNLDFEVLGSDHALSIIPHAEQINAITTLPITKVVFTDKGDKTNKSKDIIQLLQEEVSKDCTL